MPFRLTSGLTWRDRLTSTDRVLAGMWVCTGSPVVAEICAGSGVDWLLIDAEHAPNSPESVLAQLQAIAGHDVAPLVRVPLGDATIIKQYLDIGAMNLLVPMVNSAEEAATVVSATRYPPAGIRGVGSAFARASRWNRTSDYLIHAADYVSTTVQIETEEAASNAAAIAGVDGVDAVFVGPSDLAASLGLLGQQNHDDVRATVLGVISAVKSTGTPVGVNAFDPESARLYIEAGASFVGLGADISSLVLGSESVASFGRELQP